MAYAIEFCARRLSDMIFFSGQLLCGTAAPIVVLSEALQKRMHDLFLFTALSRYRAASRLVVTQ